MSRRLAVVALGSNLGESTQTLTAAAERVATLPETRLLALSSIYTSKPAVVLEQPDFKNAVMTIETALEPRELLRALQDIELEFGRVREGEAFVPGGPRTLDLDLIDIEGVVMNDPQLTLPHPEALLRDFVVTPLLEISPNHVLANQKVVTDASVNCGVCHGDVCHGDGEFGTEGRGWCPTFWNKKWDTSPVPLSQTSPVPLSQIPRPRVTC